MMITIRCGIVKLTKRKKEILNKEYENLQKFLKGDKTAQVSATNKCQALWHYKTVKPNKEYPLSLRGDRINIRKAKAFLFLKIPVFGIWGGIKIPIKPHREFPDKFKFCESKLVKQNKNYIAMLTIEFDAPAFRKCFSTLAIDLGERFTATAVLLQDRNVMRAKFYGKEIRGIRRHYAWLRKRLGEKKLLRVIKRIGRKERRRIDAILHKVSKDIVNQADSANAYIVLGDLKGIHESVRNKGKRLRRLVGNMPYYRLTEMIEYKASMKGLRVIITGERNTSKTCHICGAEGKRNTQGHFKCSHCGEYNADLNGAINIGKKFEGFLGYMPLNGVAREPALNHISNMEAHKVEAALT